MNEEKPTTVDWEGWAKELIMPHWNCNGISLTGLMNQLTGELKKAFSLGKSVHSDRERDLENIIKNRVKAEREFMPEVVGMRMVVREAKLIDRAYTGVLVAVADKLTPAIGGPLDALAVQVGRLNKAIEDLEKEQKER